MQEIVKGVLTWSWLSEPHGYNFNGYLVRHAGGNICIDPVEPEDAVLHRLSREGVARILLTHRNHARAANKVRARTGARPTITAADPHPTRAQGTETAGRRQDGVTEKGE